MEVPLSVKRDDEQHSMWYSQALPYAELLSDETETWLRDIVDYFVLSVKIRDFAPGALAAIKQLTNYLDLKHALPRSTRAALAKVLFQLTVTPGMDYALVEVWSNMCVRLIRKKKKLGPSDLVLPWRPLYEMIERSVFTKSRQKTLMSEAKHLTAVIRLVEYSQRFFDANATGEVLETFLPRFTTHSVHDAMVAQGYLVLFLPVSFANPTQPTQTRTPKDYLPTIFSLWSMFTKSSTYDAQFMDLLARIAEENIGHLDNDRKKIGLFTKEQVRLVFTTAIRMMNLPVGSRVSDAGGAGSSGGGNRNANATATTGYGHTGFKIDMKAGNGLFLRRKSEKCASLARFIIFTIVPEKGDSDQVYTLHLLGELIQAVELYFHPSNHGTWSYVLTIFVRHLAYEFLKRWRHEQEEDCEIPEERRLTSDICREFVLILRPVVFLSMFGKDQYTVGASQTTIKYLAWIEPNLIFPTLLERIYPSLETLTETHRTTSALSILTDISLPLFSRDHYPAGGKHLLPLLQLAIPGIDMNDPIKTIASLMFITSSLMTVPIVDLTTMDTCEGDDEEEYNDQMEMIDNDLCSAILPKGMENRLCRMATGDFQEWLTKFIQRIFTIFENMPQHDHKKQGGAMEAGLTQMVLHACETVFGQLSDSMYEVALRLVVEFSNNQVLPSAVRAMGALCQSITSINPKKAARHFIPMCIVNIRTELEENGASSTMTNSATSNPIQSDATLHWYQHILFSVVSDLGPELLHYKDDLLAIGHDMVNHCKSRRGMMWTGKFLRYSLKTLLDVYPTEYRSLAPDEWHDKDIMAKSHLLWGKTGDPTNLKIQWHTPSADEKSLALRILQEFLKPSILRLRQLMSNSPGNNIPNTSHELTNELCRHLAIIRNCLIGSMTMISDDGETNDILTDGNEDELLVDDNLECNQRRQHQRHTMVIAGYAFENDERSEEVRAIRREVGDLLHEMADFFKVQRENDVESIKILIKLIRVFLSERGVEKSWFDRNKSGYNYSKNISKTPICHKHYPRHLLVHRAYIHHLQRLRLNASNRNRSPIHNKLLIDLLELSMSSYAEIRKVSQSALSIAARSFKGSKSVIMPTILDTLKPQPKIDPLVYSNRMKGALYLLTHKSILMACLRDWRYIPDFILSICNAQHEDKLSIQELIRKIFLDYLSYFNQCSFRVVIAEKDITEFDHDIEVLQLSPSSLFVTYDRSSTTTGEQQHINKLSQAVIDRNNEQKKTHEKLTESILTLLANPRIHWRFSTMASNFLELLLRSEIAPTAGLASYFANTCTTSELPAMRRIGISAITQILLHIKQRTLAAGNEDLLITRSTHHPLKQSRPVASLFNNTESFDSKGHISLGEHLLNESVSHISSSSLLIDDTTTGWYVWPKQVVGYVPFSESVILPPVDPASLECHQQLEDIFSSKEYWSKLMNYMSQEPSQKQDDRFNSVNARFYASIFQTYQGDGTIQCAKDQLTLLCATVEQKNNQRAASELCAGLIRGTKHWPTSLIDQLWTEWLSPLLRVTLANVTPDSHTYWSSFLRFCVAKRDPRRVRPLLDLLLHVEEARFDPHSDAAFAEARKLIFVRAMMVGLKWRFKPWANRDGLLELYLNHLDHPYKQVREVIGANVNDIMQIQWVPSYSSVGYLLDLNAQTDGVMQVPFSLDLNEHERKVQLNAIINVLDSGFTYAPSALKESAGKAPNHYTTTSKTVLCWLREALTHWQMAGTLLYIPVFLPRVVQMQEINDDQDLQQMATHVLTLMAQMTYPPQMIPGLVDQLITILTTSTSWHIRARTLPLLQIFFFKHLFSLDTERQVVRIMQAVSTLLLDTQIEVRTIASITLGGIVRCSQRGAIDSLRLRYTALLKDTKLPKQYRDERGKLIEPEGFRDAVLQKHAGALGLSCLVNAFPYEIPEWLPTVLCQLADCMSDPAEIQSTIRKTFSDFRRTHSDTWHQDVAKFTEDQLSLLSDMLISPSYYA